MEEFSASEIAQANEDAFQSLAEADGKSLAAEITDGISTKGIENNFFRLFSILLDNAAKYCDTTGAIRLSAFRGGGISIFPYLIPTQGWIPPTPSGTFHYAEAGLPASIAMLRNNNSRGEITREKYEDETGETLR